MNRDLANVWTAYEGAVKLWILPYKPLGYIDAFSKFADSNFDDYNKNAFGTLDYVTVDCEIASHAPKIWIAFKRYWQHRKVFDIQANWESFQPYGSIELLDEWAIAYTETRDTILAETPDTTIVDESGEKKQ